MSEENIQSSIEDALAEAGGDKDDARRILMSKAMRDPEFLMLLAGDYLKELISERIDRYIDLRSAFASSDVENKPKLAVAIDLASLASQKVSADKVRKSTLPPPKTSELQALAMRKIVAAFEKNKRK